MVGSFSTTSIKATNHLITALVVSQSFTFFFAFSGLESDMTSAILSVIILRPVEISLILTNYPYLSYLFKFLSRIHEEFQHYH